MPVHGAAPFLDKALQSIAIQTRPFDQICIVLDRPESNAEALVRKLADEADNVLVVYSQSPGLAAALNRGLDQVTTDLVFRFDSDDVMHARRCELQTEFLSLNPEIDLLGSQAVYIDTSGTFKGRSYLPLSHNEIKSRIKSSNPMIHPSLAFRTFKLAEIGGYDEEFATAEDLAVILKLINQGSLVRNLGAELIAYRFHKDQMTSRAEQLRLFEDFAYAKYRPEMSKEELKFGKRLRELSRTPSVTEFIKLALTAPYLFTAVMWQSLMCRVRRCFSSEVSFSKSELAGGNKSHT
jgi:glycosyltransferase involved in cell wall biosynthesis